MSVVDPDTLDMASLTRSIPLTILYNRTNDLLMIGTIVSRTKIFKTMTLNIKIADSGISISETLTLEPLISLSLILKSSISWIMLKNTIYLENKLEWWDA